MSAILSMPQCVDFQVSGNALTMWQDVRLDLQTPVPYIYIYLYIQNLKFVITVPADALAPYWG